MLDSTKLTNQENIHLTDEIAVVAPKATPLMTLLMGKGQYKQGGAKIHTWREKSLDFSDATVAEGVDAENFINSESIFTDGTTTVYTRPLRSLIMMLLLVWSVFQPK